MSQEVEKDQRLFKSRIFERLTHTHFSVPLILYYGISAGLIIHASVHSLLGGGRTILLFLVGFLSFTLFEYFVHRVVFHMAPTNKLKKWIAYSFHGVHHDHPNDKTRLAMPPVVSILLAAITYIAFRWVMGNNVYGFLPGFLSGYATYLFVHYIVHARRAPKNFLRILWIHHGIHHHKDDTVAFGVSSPFWDWVFGTMPRKGNQ